jgi:hypothetical protein
MNGAARCGVKRRKILYNFTNRYISYNRVLKSIRKSTISMSKNPIKWLATIIMIIDHVGFLLERQSSRSS